MSGDPEAPGFLWEGIPDSRVKGPLRSRTTFTGPGGKLFERVYCANCGGDGGAILASWSPHVFYLCDPCAQTHGNLPLPQLPDELVRGL